MEFIKVVSAQYVDGYRIRLEFNDGKIGIADLKNDLWGPVFEPLKDINKFKDFKVSDLFDTIKWSNGADLAPEYLYNKVVASEKVSLSG